ncbi:MAG: hypothetical protein KDA79_03860 [Planctomycetaceae bacterium]|nr:hypothetical protein [Planctomycetaceae bacterium]
MHRANTSNTLRGLALVAGLLVLEGTAPAQCANGGGGRTVIGGSTAQTSFSSGGTATEGASSGLMSLAGQAMQLQFQMVQARQQEMIRQQQFVRQQQMLRQQEIRNLTSAREGLTQPPALASNQVTTDTENPASLQADEDAATGTSPPAMTKRERLIARLKERAAARQQRRLKYRQAGR